MRIENPKISSKEIIKHASEKWAVLSYNEKEKFQKQFQINYATYCKKRDEFYNSLTADQKSLLDTLKQKKKIISKKKIDEMKEEALGKPKRPLNAFHKFARENRGESDERSNKWNTFLQMKKKWSSLELEKKEKYIAEAKESMIQYKDALLEWEKQMINLGHINIVRRTTLQLLNKAT